MGNARFSSMQIPKQYPVDSVNFWTLLQSFLWLITGLGWHWEKDVLKKVAVISIIPKNPKLCVFRKTEEKMKTDKCKDTSRYYLFTLKIKNSQSVSTHLHFCVSVSLRSLVLMSNPACRTGWLSSLLFACILLEVHIPRGMNPDKGIL